MDAVMEGTAAETEGSAAGNSGGKRTAKKDDRKTGVRRALTVEIDESAYDRLWLHEGKTRVRKGVILEDLILDHLPNWVVSKRESRSGTRSSSRPEEVSAVGGGGVKDSGETLPDGETLTPSGASEPPARSGQGRRQRP